MDALIKLDDGLRVDGLELGLVQVVAGGGAEAVGAAARVGHLVVVVFELGEADWTPGGGRDVSMHTLEEWDGTFLAESSLVSASNIPVAFATALFLGVGRRLAGVSGLAEVLWQVVFWGGSAVGQAGVIAVSQLVGAGHCW